jgi:probable HAF family extracellular repeat protein
MQINASGEVTGGSDTGAFLHDGATMIDIGVSRGNGLGVNNLGQVTGDSGQGDASIYDGTVIFFLRGFGSGINDARHVVGYDALTGRAFLYDGTGIAELWFLAGGVSVGYGVNADDAVTGFARTSQRTSHAFLFDDSMKDLGTLGGTQSLGFRVNGSWHVVGDSLVAGDRATRGILL